MLSAACRPSSWKGLLHAGGARHHASARQRYRSLCFFTPGPLYLIYDTLIIKYPLYLIILTELYKNPRDIVNRGYTFKVWSDHRDRNLEAAANRRLAYAARKGNSTVKDLTTLIRHGWSTSGVAASSKFKFNKYCAWFVPVSFPDSRCYDDSEDYGTIQYDLGNSSLVLLPPGFRGGAARAAAGPPGRRHGHAVLVAEGGGAAAEGRGSARPEWVGLCELEVRLAIWLTGRVAPYLRGLAVLPSGRRRGAARALLARCEALAASWGHGEICLDVLEEGQRRGGGPVRLGRLRAVRAVGPGLTTCR
ncbi:unnamed protein product [Prorocentrum cordatum]|uniref:N-acetyltransferase domain-containing protein n=1 Tax=Prorocentrum cordatum TaxID=2364126 RepID=A0ABN9SSB1_9DINO|nr:unnamed protein product [Polarella glacialis]